MDFRWLVIAIALITNCQDKKADSSSGGGVPSDDVVVAGSLANGDDESNKEILAGQDVLIKASDGTVVGLSSSDDNGDFEINIAAGALDVGSGAALSSTSDLKTIAQVDGTDFIFESTVEDDGDGKALGVRQTIDLSSSQVSGKQGDASLVNIGSQALVEIGAISGSVTFADESVSPLGTDVFVPGKSFFSRTAADGKFYLLFVPADTYTLRIENGVFFKEVEVVVKSGKTTALGEVEVALADRNPLPLDDVLVGTWSTKCWTSSTATDAPLTGEITITSLTATSYTGTSCLSHSYNGGAGAQTLASIGVLSDGALILTHKIITTQVASTEFARVVQYSNNKITFDLSSGNYIEVFERVE